MLLLSVSAFATGNGDYCVHITHGIPTHVDSALIGYTNTFEIWVANDDLLGGMSPAVEIVIDVAFAWNMGYGSHPPVNEEGRAVGVWNLPDLQVAQDFDDASPEHLLLGGAAMPGAGLPAGASELCYTLQFDIPGGEAETRPGIHITPYVYPPAGTWTFTDGAGGYPPDFCGSPTGSETQPVGLVEFNVVELPCLPPVWVATPPAVVDQNHCIDYTFQLMATEGGNTPPADPVTYGGDFTNAGGQIFRPYPCSSFVEPLEVWAMNACGGQVFYNFEIHWFSNPPVITNCPTTHGRIAKGNTWTYDFDVVDPDPCDVFTWTVVCDETIPSATCPCPPFGTYGIDGNGVFTFNTDDLDGGCIYGFKICVYDKTGLVDCCDIEVEVLATEPFVIRIKKAHDVLQGHYVWICVGQCAGSELIGGYDFLIAYDASALTFISAKLGMVLEAQGWEYFTYRYGPWGNCTGPCPSGFVRLVAIADMNNGPYHPTGFGGSGQLASLKFYVTNDRTYHCQFVPIRFVWQDCGDCGDNALSSVTGDTLFIMQRVFDFEWQGADWVCGDPIDFGDDSYELTWIDWDLGFGFLYGGPDPECTVCVEFYPDDHPEFPGLCKNKPIQFIWFWNGGVDIICKESIDVAGDINLNGIGHEIADAVLFTNYFLYGIGVFHIALEGQIAATDVNNDGLVLSVGDLVYLIRVITGDALPYPKLAPFANSVDVNVVNGLVSVNSSNDVGAMYATFEVNGAYEVVNHTDMELVSNAENGELRVLLYSGLDDMSNYVPAGESQLFTVVGNAELVTAEVSDFNGNMLTTNVHKTALPTAYALQQNVPNPFNPTTRITLELPELSNWNLDIYNVAGQLVESFSGNDLGVITVEWNATNFASGVYFYRMTAGAFADTKKMVLMK
jgi:hypothetical protein